MNSQQIHSIFFSNYDNEQNAVVNEKKGLHQQIEEQRAHMQIIVSLSSSQQKSLFLINTNSTKWHKSNAFNAITSIFKLLNMFKNYFVRYKNNFSNFIQYIENK